MSLKILKSIQKWGASHAVVSDAVIILNHKLNVAVWSARWLAATKEARRKMPGEPRMPMYLTRKEIMREQLGDAGVIA